MRNPFRFVTTVVPRVTQTTYPMVSLVLLTLLVSVVGTQGVSQQDVRRHFSLAESAEYKQMAVVHSSSSSMPNGAPELRLTAQTDYPSSLIGVPVVMATGRPLASG